MSHLCIHLFEKKVRIISLVPHTFYYKCKYCGELKYVKTGPEESKAEVKQMIGKRYKDIK